MEKLIELLNEYEPYIKSDWIPTDNFWWYVSQWNSAVFPKEVWIDRIISNEYGFIKWLVDNDKIDNDKLEVAYENEEDLYIEWDVCRDYRIILMLLAIQDNPIKFLLSIIK